MSNEDVPIAFCCQADPAHFIKTVKNDLEQIKEHVIHLETLLYAYDPITISEIVKIKKAPAKIIEISAHIQREIEWLETMYANEEFTEIENQKVLNEESHVESIFNLAKSLGCPNEIIDDIKKGKDD
jgi:hypothetical protein